MASISFTIKPSDVSVEAAVASAILQQEDGELEVGPVKAKIPRATPATLMLVSSLIPSIPAVTKKPDNVLNEVLRIAKDTDALGKIAAALILGAKRIREGRMVQVPVHGEKGQQKQKKQWSWRHLRFVPRKETLRDVSEFEYLADTILYEMSPEAISAIISKRLLDMQIGPFFGLTTSLSEVNILKPTREAETAHGA